MTDTANIQDRRAKPSWMVVWTGRMAPAVAGVIVERLFTNESVVGISDLFGVSAQDARSGVLFAFIVLLTDPMVCVNVLCAAIESVRAFFCAAGKKIRDAFNKPIEGENE